MFLMLPIKDLPPNRERDHRPLPTATIALLVANIGIFLFITLPIMNAGPNVYHEFVVRYGFRATEPSLSTILSALFLHGGWLHVLGNMFTLWIFGPAVEAKLGRVRFLLAYLMLGVVASLTYGALNQHSSIPLLGASGAIFGILGLYFLWFPLRRIRTFLMILWLFRFAELPARLVLGITLVVYNIIPFLLDSQTGVAYSAHLGGFAGGLLLAWAWQYNASAPQSRPTFVPTGSAEKALAHYSDLAPHERAALPADTIFELADGLSSAEHVAQALAVLQRFIATHPTDPALHRAHLRAGVLHWEHFQKPTPAYQHMLTVLDLAPDSAEAQEARKLLRAIESVRPSMH